MSTPATQSPPILDGRDIRPTDYVPLPRGTPYPTPANRRGRSTTPCPPGRVPPRPPPRPQSSPPVTRSITRRRNLEIIRSRVARQLVFRDGPKEENGRVNIPVVQRTSLMIPLFNNFDLVDPCTSAYKIHDMLTEYSLLDPYIYRYPISFKDGSEKINWWNSCPDAWRRSTFSQLYAAPKGECNAWFFLFSGWRTNWVGRPMHEWDNEPWHAWAGAIIKGKIGKHLLIYDCDPVKIGPTGPDPRRAEVLSSQALRFVKWVEENKAPFSGVWLNQDLRYSGMDLCLSSALYWIRETARLGDHPVDDPYSDVRLKNFTPIARR